MTIDRDRKRIEELLEHLRPRVDLSQSIRKKLEDIVENCRVACAFVGRYMEDLYSLPDDMQVVVGDIMRDSIQLRLKCARLLALNRLDNLPVAEVEQQWEEL